MEEISLAVDQMNGVTQQTAANTQESAASAEELTSQASRLRELVDEFQLSGGRASSGHGALPQQTIAGAGPTPGLRSSNGYKDYNGNGDGNGNGRGHAPASDPAGWARGRGPSLRRAFE